MAFILSESRASGCLLSAQQHRGGVPPPSKIVSVSPREVTAGQGAPLCEAYPFRARGLRSSLGLQRVERCASDSELLPICSFHSHGCCCLLSGAARVSLELSCTGVTWEALPQPHRMNPGARVPAPLLCKTDLPIEGAPRPSGKFPQVLKTQRASLASTPAGDCLRCPPESAGVL